MSTLDNPSPWEDADRLELEPGDIVMREGETTDTVFEVVDGALEVLRGNPMRRIDTVGPGSMLGEIAALAGTPRRATVRALGPAVVRRIDRRSYEAWLAADEQRLVELTALARARIDRHGAISMFTELLGVDEGTAAEIADVGSWRHVDAGDVVFAEGDPSDSGYLVVSGRLAVTRDGAILGEVGRGEIVGEIGLLEAAPRSATVTALRDSSLIGFDVDAFAALTATHPRLMLNLVRTIVARAGRPGASTDRGRSVAVAVTAAIDGHAVVSALADELTRHGDAHHIWAARIDGDLGRPGLIESGRSVAVPAVSEYIHDIETTHDYVVLEADPDDTRWTRLALALADRVMVVMSANADDDELRRAERILTGGRRRTEVERWLALVQPAGTDRPTGTAAIADQIGFDRVVQLRAGVTDDLRRLARLVSGNGTGLVLGGGGARGFAHLGVWRALSELGIDVDVIGGASIGAPLGAGMAMRVAPSEFVPLAMEMFRGLLDYTVPVVSLVKGARITRNITSVFGGLDVRDLWLPFFCVSTNLTRSRLEVHDRRDLATAIRASVAIPGILPPVPFEGDLLVDGGVLNNLPCDVMRATQMVSRLIAIDLSPAVGPRADDDFGLSVSGWRALRAHVGSNRSRFPGVVAILMRAMVAGSTRDRDRVLADGTVDLYLDLDLHGVRLLDFDRVAETAERGYQAAMPRLEAWLQGSGSDRP